MRDAWSADEDRYFDPEPARRSLARQLYESVREVPIVSPHGHVDPQLLADPEATLGTPAELFVIPDHYVFRMLYSQGVRLEELGIPTRDGGKVEEDHRRIWQVFADNFYLFRGTPTGLWLADELATVFGIEESLTGASAQEIYDRLESMLERPEYSPRSLFERFGVEVLCTTDGAADDLRHHRALHDGGWGGRVLPTFRPDAVTHIDAPGWSAEIANLSDACDTEIGDYGSYIAALEERRAYFKDMGAVATDHSATTPFTERLPKAEAESIFRRALSGEASADEAIRFTAHMLVEYARMSSEDGLVMQLHAGSLRGHNVSVAERFGPDRGADIPVATEWTRNLRALLNERGNDDGLTLVVFTLDESTYARELAPLAGHYPSLLLGAPWWFYDSPSGMRRYLDCVTETAGFHNLAGFNDDTRAFASIPVRHDVWRRVTCDWLSGMVLSGRLDEEGAADVAQDLAHRLARRAYGLDKSDIG